MIKELFLPIRIAGRQLLSQRIVGIDIGRMHVSASQVYSHNNTTTIEKCISSPLEAGTQSDYDERVINALKDLKPQLDRYDLLCTTVPSSIAVIKELTLPFTQPEKIKMVLDYEVEPLLPFSAREAAVGGIITRIMPQEHKSLVLAAAVPKEHIAHHIQIMQSAGFDPDTISIDFFDLYHFYRMMPGYEQQSGSHALIDLESYSTRIGYIQDGALRLVRTLPKGIISQVKTISDALGMQPSAVMEQIMRFGFNHEDQSFAKALKDALDTFWRDISFTLNSFTAQSDQKLDSILIMGSGTDIRGLPAFITEKTDVPCEKISLNRITERQDVTIKQNGTIAQTCALSLASALVTHNGMDFNLRTDEFASDKTPLFIKQLITAGVLSCAIIVSLITYTIYELSSLKNEISVNEQELSQELVDRFSIPEDEVDDLDTLIETAQQKVTESERLVFAFSGGHRASFLQYLLELTRLIDKQALDFKLNRLQISDDTLTLEGSVRDHDVLKIFEKDLRKSKLFTYTDQQPEPQFNITIPLSKNGGGY